ncbi:MAG TPA: SAM-dependent chlorinase/fluorinase, partial [Balneolales bacterium]|nr:SAM-dependent chlorinase/fluorinase [Balneolales bacterium]
MPKKDIRNPILTLTSDFGNQDQYVSAMKAVILGITPDVRLVDISHEIPPQDIMAAAWVLKNTAFLYPPGTVHLAVIDPGVGTIRKPIAVKIRDQYFVGPDNGLFSL